MLFYCDWAPAHLRPAPTSKQYLYIGKASMRIVVISGLSDDKLRSKILPITQLEDVETLYLIRRKPLDMPKVITYVPPPIFLRFLPFAEVYRFLTVLYLSLFKKPDFILGIYFIPHGIYASIAGLITGKRVIQALIGSDFPRVVNSRIWMALLKKASHIAVRGNNSKNTLISKGIAPDIIFIPPNVLDLSAFKPADIGSEAVKKYDLVCVGNLIPSKRVDLLVEIVSHVRQTLPNLRVAVVGDGPERDKIINLVAEHQLHEVVDMLGYCTQPEIVRCLQQSRAFIMTTELEGLPMAMIEAISCGLPVIMPDINDVTDVAKHGENAWIVNPPTVENYVQAVLKILTDEAVYKRLAQGALDYRHKFARDFTAENVAKIWRNVLA